MSRLLAPLAALIALALAAPAGAASPDLVVSQLYGGGGNTGAPFNNDYIEIFNRGDSSVSLTDKSLQYTSAAGTGNFGGATNLLTELPAVDVAPGHYFLVQEAAGTTPSAPLPAPDSATDTTPINMAAGAGKVALVDGTAGLGCNGGSTPCGSAALGRIIDLVGYGNANFFEGSGAAPTASNTSSVQRDNGGCADTDDNAADFDEGAPTPRNSSLPRHFCDADTAPSVSSTDPANNEAEVPLDANAAITFSEPVNVADGAFSLTCTTSGDHDVSVSGDGTTFTLDPAEDFVRNETCTVTVHATAVTDQDENDPPDAMAADRLFRFFTLGLELRIHDIQGAQHLSPYEGAQASRVPGIVTAVKNNGFFFQDPDPDSHEATSEGMFVFTSSAPTVKVGDSVRVSGRVTEFRPGATDLTITELGFPVVETVAHDATVAPTLVGIGGRIPPLFVISDDAAGGDVDNPGTRFDPREDGIDFHESLEGMLVRVRQPMAVGPTNSFGELPVVADGGLLGFPRTARGGVLIRPSDFNPERIILDGGVGFDTPTANVRDRLSNVTAVVDYSFGNFKYLVTATPELQSGGLKPETTQSPGANELAVASMNVENLAGDEGQEKYDRLARIVVDNLKAPDILAAEEIQDNDGAPTNTSSDATLTWTRFIAAIQTAGGPTYQYRQIDPVPGQDGGEPGGNIRVGFLFRADRGVTFVDRPGGTAVNATEENGALPGAQLTFSPGRLQDPADATTFANSRKPLVGEFRWKGKTYFVIGNHFNSKGGDEPLFGHVQPPNRISEVQRHKQAAIVGAFVDTLLKADRNANVVVAGDFNDFDFSETLDILEGRGRLSNLMETLPVFERYSYVFDGNSQVLDQVLVSRNVAATRPEYDSVHVNAEFADQASDHDPQVARLKR
jgi:predicted extracellular nuclease